MSQRTPQSGFTIIEIIIGLALFAVIFIYIAETLTVFFATQNRILASTQALYLAEAGQEFVRYLRDEDWSEFSGLSPDTTYYLDVGTSTVATSSTPEVIGQFTRRFVLHQAYRNSDDDLVASTTAGASPDPDSFMVVTLVTWGNGEQVRLESFLGNLYDE